MSVIHVVYHHEAGVWWAESDDLPGFSALADNFSDTAALVREAVDVSDQDLQIREELDGGGVLLHGRSVSSGTVATWTQRAAAPTTDDIIAAHPELLQTA